MAEVTTPAIAMGAGAVRVTSRGPGASPEHIDVEPVLAQRQVRVDGVVRDVVLQDRGRGRRALLEGGATRHVMIEPPRRRGRGTLREVIVDGFRFEVEVESARVAAHRERATREGGPATASGPVEVRAVIPGKILAVSVGVGDTVEAGQQLVVIEAMKMQNELRASRAGTIERVGVTAGATIDVGQLLVVIR